MNKYCMVRKSDWDQFVSGVDPNTLSYWKLAVGRLPNHLFVSLSEATWELAKATGKFLTLPPPWANVARLSGPVKNILGPLAPDAASVGDAIQDLTGKNIFND